MSGYLPLIYDAAILLVFIAYIGKGMSRGFLRGMAELVSWLTAMAVGVLGSTVMAPLIYNATIREPIIAMVEKAVAGAVSPEVIMSQISDKISSLPSIVRNVMKFSGGDLQSEISRIAKLNASEIAQAAADTVIGPVVLGIVQILVFLVIFVVVLFVMHLLCRVLNGVNHIPFIGPINAVLGAVFGAVQSVIFISVLALILQMVIAGSDNSISYLNIDIVHSTMFLNYFFKYNPVLMAFGLVG